MKKLTLALLLSLSLSHADISGVKQGYGDARQTSPMGPQQSYQDYRKSMAPPARPAKPAPNFAPHSAGTLPSPPTRATPLPPVPAISQNKPQGILFGDIKTKFGNLRKLLSAAEQLVTKGNLTLKYGNNLKMVYDELTKLEHAVGSGRTLQSIHDQEVLENSTFGKNKFDQEKYNNLLGIAKQTAMSACTEMESALKQGLRSNAGRGNAANFSGFSSTCGQLKGTQDVAQFVSMVQNLVNLTSSMPMAASGNMNTAEASQNLTEVKAMIANTITLAKSKLIGPDKKTIDSTLKGIIKQYKDIEKSQNSKKGSISDPSNQVHSLIDQTHAIARKTCSAISANAKTMVQKAAKGKKAEVIQERGFNAMNAFSQTCDKLGQVHTNIDIVRVLTDLTGKSRTIALALKGK